MLGRRNLRIKVMQTLYGYELNRELPSVFLENQLKNNIEKLVTLYITNLTYAVEVCLYAVTYENMLGSKYIKSDEDKAFNTNLANNQIARNILAHPVYDAIVKKEKIKHYVDANIVKQLFNDLLSKTKFKEYLAIPEPSLEDDRTIFSYLVKKVMAVNKDLAHHLEEHFINYGDENLLLLHLIEKYLEQFDGTDKNVFLAGIEVWEGEKKFAFDLLKNVLNNYDSLQELIIPFLNNWDPDRVAIMDMLIIKMAITELKYCPNIPVKVSINEYIDISKLYSTPKSKDFVNGVLDKIKAKLIADGSIKKLGRGLVND